MRHGLLRPDALHYAANMAHNGGGKWPGFRSFWRLFEHHHYLSLMRPDDDALGAVREVRAALASCKNAEEQVLAMVSAANWRPQVVAAVAVIHAQEVRESSTLCGPPAMQGAGLRRNSRPRCSPWTVRSADVR